MSLEEAVKEGESLNGSMPEPQEEVEVLEVNTTEETETKGEASEGKPVPLPSFLEQKAKWKAKAQDAEETAEELQRKYEAQRAELALYKAAQSDEGEKHNLVPDRYDYDTDEQYAEATREYYSKIAEETAQSKLEQHLEAQRQQMEQQQAEEKQKAVFDKHYEQAAAFGASDYVEAEDNFKRVFGKDIAQNIITVLSDFGTDSAKAAYHLGKNESKMNELLTTLSQNPAVGLLAIKSYVDSIDTTKTTPNAAPDEPQTSTGGGLNVDWKTKIDKSLDALQAKKTTMKDHIALLNQARAAGVNV